MEKPKEQKPQQPVKATATTVQFTRPVIVNVETEVKPLATITDSVVIASVASGGKPGGTPVVGETGDKPSGEGTGDKPASAPIATGTEVADYAEIMPSYPGGVEALRKFLQKNLTNPKEMEEGEEVSVKMKFVVGIDGKLQSFETVQDGGEEFNKEVMRVLKKMPNWVPGKTHGQNVSVYFTIPVKFVSAN
ncbi:MAG: energy transducer TonB [Ferruginibacter sp.]